MHDLVFCSIAEIALVIEIAVVIESCMDLMHVCHGMDLMHAFTKHDCHGHVPANMC